jgi:hypothetical protein
MRFTCSANSPTIEMYLARADSSRKRNRKYAHTYSGGNKPHLETVSGRTPNSAANARLVSPKCLNVSKKSIRFAHVSGNLIH